MCSGAAASSHFAGCLRPFARFACVVGAHFDGCLRPFAFPLRTLSDVCGRLLALLALCWMSAAVCSPPSYFGGCLRPFARSPRTFADVCGRSFVLASRCATLATSRPPRPSRDWADSIAETDHWLSNSCFEPQLQGVPSFAARFCGCLRPFAFRLRTSPDVCGHLLALLALCQMSAAVCSLSTHFASVIPNTSHP